MPATITQPRKKPFTSRRPLMRPHRRPAARKPLYRPWLAASTADWLANSGVVPKIRWPTGSVQRNISRTRKPTWLNITIATSSSAMIRIVSLPLDEYTLEEFRGRLNHVGGPTWRHDVVGGTQGTVRGSTLDMEIAASMMRRTESFGSSTSLVCSTNQAATKFAATGQCS